MKTLILVRHAKSSWDAVGLEDFERPLNERGKEDAPLMAKRLKDKKIKPDIFLSSPAKRALKTARYFGKEFGFGKKDIVVEDKLYGAAVSSFLEVITNIKNKHKAALVFSHNHGLTDFANTLTTVHIDNIPTTGLFAVQADCEKWADFVKSEKSFLFFDYPKNNATLS